VTCGDQELQSQGQESIGHGESAGIEIPLSGAKWAAGWEAYAALIAEHLSPSTTWLDAGCGRRLLEEDLDPLEDWLADHCGRIIGMDVSAPTHRNISLLVQGSLYALPFGDSSLDLITCHMVVEHLDDPARAFAEAVRCLRPGGALIVKTPNLLNYGVFGNAIASKVMPEKWRLRLVKSADSREPEDIFPVRYRANTMRRLKGLLKGSGLRVHKAIELPQQGAFFRKTQALENLLIKLTPSSALLLCSHKPDIGCFAR
jgi:SAM-dependent methyltransferase